MPDSSVAQFLYEEGSLGVFILITVLMGGGAAWLAGRAIAATWRPWWHAAIYMLILGMVVRFMHFALFEGTLIAPYYYLVDAAFCLIFGLLGYRVTRAGQMVMQYRWLFNRSGPFSWVRR